MQNVKFEILLTQGIKTSLPRMHLLKFSPLICQKTDQTLRVPMFASVPLCYRNHIGAVLKKKKKK